MVRPHSSSSTVRQIGGFEAQKHQLGIEKADVGQVGAEEVEKTTLVVEVVLGCRPEVRKRPVPVWFLHGAS